jgi:hypothetical protein
MDAINDAGSWSVIILNPEALSALTNPSPLHHYYDASVRRLSSYSPDG